MSQTPKVVAVVPTMRGVLAIANDGRTWYLADPYFGDKQQWEEYSAIPLERSTQSSDLSPSAGERAHDSKENAT